MTSTSFRPLLALLVCASLLGCESEEARMKREWKALNDTISICSQKIQNIVSTMQATSNITEASQQRLIHDIDSIDRHMKDAIRRCRERNKDNDLGRYIKENYTEE